MKVELTGKVGDFVLENKGAIFTVTAVDDEDKELADAATVRVMREIGFAYSPAIGSMVHFAAAVASRFLGCKIVTEIPPSNGELEQAYTASNK